MFDPRSGRLGATGKPGPRIILRFAISPPPREGRPVDVALGYEFSPPGTFEIEGVPPEFEALALEQGGARTIPVLDREQ